jgi:hypothetical protein
VREDFVAHVRQVLGPLGVHVDESDLQLMELLHDMLTQTYEPLLRADVEHFPHEPVDPSRAPER